MCAYKRLVFLAWTDHNSVFYTLPFELIDNILETYTKIFSKNEMLHQYLFMQGNHNYKERALVVRVIGKIVNGRNYAVYFTNISSNRHKMVNDLCRLFGYHIVSGPLSCKKCPENDIRTIRYSLISGRPPKCSKCGGTGKRIYSKYVCFELGIIREILLRKKNLSNSKFSFRI